MYKRAFQREKQDQTYSCRLGVVFRMHPSIDSILRGSRMNSVEEVSPVSARGLQPTSCLVAGVSGISDMGVRGKAPDEGELNRDDGIEDEEGEEGMGVEEKGERGCWIHG